MSRFFLLIKQYSVSDTIFLLCCNFAVLFKYRISILVRKQVTGSEVWSAIRVDNYVSNLYHNMYDIIRCKEPICL